jgi:hypothetical protein
MSQIVPSRRKSRPWALAGGLLVASGVTLIGVARNLDPDIVLFRAAVAGAGSAAALTVGRIAVSRFLSSEG